MSDRSKAGSKARQRATIAAVWVVFGVALLVSGHSLFGALWLVLAVVSAGIAWRDRRQHTATHTPKPPVSDAH